MRKRFVENVCSSVQFRVGWLLSYIIDNSSNHTELINQHVKPNRQSIEEKMKSDEIISHDSNSYVWA